MAYYNKGEYDKAIELYRKALEIKEKVLGKEHPSTATSYNNIGLAYYNKGKYDKAMEFYRKAEKIREQKLGPDHPYTKDVKESIEFVLQKMKEESENKE